MMRLPTDGVSKAGMRTRNISALLAAIHYGQSVSRVELATALGLSRTTVSALVDELLNSGLIISTGAEAPSRAGRPRELLTPRLDSAVMVINPEVDGTTIALVAMGGTILHKASLTHSRSRSPERVAAQVRAYLAEQAASVPCAIEAAVLAVPGAVSANTETVVSAPSLRWRAVRANPMFEDLLGVPVSTINNARAATVGEWAFGALRGRRDGICIFSGAGGIGGGLLVNGVVLGGAHGFAGEIGKMRVHDSDLGLPDNLSFEHVMRRDAIVGALGFSVLSDEQLRAELCDAVRTRTLQPVEDQRRVLANALASLRDLLDPEVIVLGGYFGALLEAQGSALLREINIGAIAKRGNDFLVSRSVGLGDMVLLGAAESHWKQVLADPLEHRTRPHPRRRRQEPASTEIRKSKESQ